MSMSSHQSAAMKSDTWLTPPHWIEALGPFDTDPCCPLEMPWRTATTMIYGENSDGLVEPWDGRIWLNPPFGQEWPDWVEKLADHGNGIALIPARTETREFYRLVWERAHAVCFVKGRPHFYTRGGHRAPFNSGAPIALIAYGSENVAALERAALGIVLTLSSLPDMEPKA